MARLTTVGVLRAWVIAVFVAVSGTAPDGLARELPQPPPCIGGGCADITTAKVAVTRGPNLSAPRRGDGSPMVTDLRHIDMRAAALLMSGQRGGDIDGVLIVGVPESAGEILRVPFWIELEKPPNASPERPAQWTLEVFVYALDDQLEVEVFEGRTLRLDLGTSENHLGGGVKLHGGIEVSPSVHRLRVLVRDEGDAFYLDEGMVPFTAQEMSPREGLVVFPDTGEGWINVDSIAWDPARGGFEAIDIGGARYSPEGRPVVLTESAVSCFVVTTRLDQEMSTVTGRLYSISGQEREAGSFEVVDRLPTENNRFVGYSVKWRVPELDPDLYHLELSLSGESGDPITAEISVIAVPPGIASEHPTWVAYVGAPPPGAAPRASASPNAYSRALELCISDRWNEGVAEVFELERRTIGDSPSADLPADLFTLEATAIKTLVDNTAGSIIPLLVLHHDVFMAWTEAGNPVGQEHAIRLIAAMVNDIQKRSTLAPATSTAVGVLASIGNTLYRHGVFDSALEVLELALTLDPNHQASLLGTAADHEWFGHYEETVEILDGLGERSDALFEGRLRRGVNLARIGRTRDAVAELRACTHRSAPAWVRTVAYEELALFHLDNKRPEEAEAMIEEAIAQFPRETTLRLLLAYTLEVRGHLGEARRVLARLDQQPVTSYRESPRRRYGRWPSEVFEEERRSIRVLAVEHLGDLAAAMAAHPSLRGQ